MKNKKANQIEQSTWKPIKRKDGTITGWIEMFWSAHLNCYVTIPGASRFRAATN